MNRKITVIRGHLTQTEKRHINALLDRNLSEGKVNTKTYYLNECESCFVAVIYENKTNPSVMVWNKTHTKLVAKAYTEKRSVEFKVN